MRGCYEYPFTAVAGQDKLKLALILNAVNPRIGGVLISGDKGTAKSTLVRALAAVSDKTVTEIPLNVTEDRLVGTLDISAAVNGGERCFEKGLLYNADGNFLYVDEVNLLGAHISNILAEVVARGENVVERDGISYCHPCRCIIIGTMNPEEGFLRPQLLDKFGLFVNAESEKDIDVRTEIIRRRLQYETDPVTFCGRYAESDEKLSQRIRSASDRLNAVTVPEEILQLIALTADRSHCEGNRCEIILAETAKALCAWRDGGEINADDVSDAAQMVLPHRMKNNPPAETVCRESGSKAENQDTEPEDSESGNAPQEEYCFDSESSDAIQHENTEASGAEIPLTADGIKNIRKNGIGSGKRCKVSTDESFGRYVRSINPHKKTCDIAIIPTLCSAAVNQRFRTSAEGMKITVKKSDFRQKLREKRTGATILFLVDASGSMGAKRRMRAVKGAVSGLLSEAYQKRDRVGVVAFRDDGAQVILNITGSPVMAKKCMETLPTGGKTPLADGIAAADALLRAERIRTPDAVQYLVLISDGKANVALRSDNPIDDALQAAEQIGLTGVGAMVLDTESGYIRFGFAKQIAERMNAQYIKLDDISRTAVEANVREFVSDMNA